MAREANLSCCCCGASCKGKQWWNRDKGFGFCGKCHTWLKGKGISDEEIHQDYGVEGLHFHAERKETVTA